MGDGIESSLLTFRFVVSHVMKALMAKAVLLNWSKVSPFFSLHIMNVATVG